MFGLDKFGGIGLHRIQRFLDERKIDVDRLARRSLVITGTNGKGSTAHLTGAALAAHGLRVGVFTSPHMFDIRERFLLDGQQIRRPDFDRLAAEVMAFNETLPPDDRLGAFQFLFLVALIWFEETAPDAIVWEAGIGGRYDPIRMVRAKFGAVTSVELEHTEVLGGTEELIAYDKVDAVAPGGAVLLSPLVPSYLRARLETYCDLSQRRLIAIADTRHIEKAQHDAAGAHFRLAIDKEPARNVELAMIGDYQANNAVTADMLAHVWLEDAGETYDAEASWAALGGVRVPGRLEKISSKPDVWIDVGHTPLAVDGAIKSLLNFIPAADVIVVFGVSASKEVDAISKTVAGAFSEFILTRAHRSGAEPDRFRGHFAATGANITVEPDISRAAQIARDRATATGKTILAIGGLFLAAEFQTAWNGGDPKAIDFL